MGEILHPDERGRADDAGCPRRQSRNAHIHAEDHDSISDADAGLRGDPTVDDRLAGARLRGTLGDPPRTSDWRARWYSEDVSDVSLAARLDHVFGVEDGNYQLYTRD